MQRCCRPWTARLCDLGLSRFVGAGTCFPSPGEPLHSPGWQAPEVLSGERYGRAADVFSFGVVLWEVMTLQVSARFWAMWPLTTRRPMDVSTTAVAWLQTGRCCETMPTVRLRRGTLSFACRLMSTGSAIRSHDANRASRLSCRLQQPWREEGADGLEDGCGPAAAAWEAGLRERVCGGERLQFPGAHLQRVCMQPVAVREPVWFRLVWA